VITHDKSELLLAAILAASILGLLIWGWLYDARERRDPEIHAYRRFADAILRHDEPKGRWR
jgi:hypothetical protein